MSLYEVNPDSIQLMAHPHEREIEVFEAALELPPGQREAYIEQASTGNPDLSQRVRALLHAAENGAEFLTTAPSELAPSRPIIEKPGDLIGRYKLLEQIGEGGCGIVYRAAQEEPIRRQVALKVIKLGMDTRQVIRTRSVPANYREAWRSHRPLQAPGTNRRRRLMRSPGFSII